MIVKCIRNKVDDTLANELGLPKGEGIRNYSDCLTIGKEYVVLALSHFLDSYNYANYPIINIKDDIHSYLIPFPLFLFEVIDDRPSKYWHFNYDKERKVCEMAPISFYQEYYHDLLSDGYPELEEDFRQICELLENELYKYDTEYLKFKDFINLNNSKSIKEGVKIENPWVKCPECAETSKIDNKDKTYECKECKSIIINPYYNSGIE
jgi:hypothetical protein